MDTLMAFAPHTAAAAIGFAVWIRCGAFHETFGVGLPTWRNAAIAAGAYVAVMVGISFGAFDWVLDLVRYRPVGISDIRSSSN